MPKAPDDLDPRPIGATLGPIMDKLDRVRAAQAAAIAAGTWSPWDDPQLSQRVSGEDWYRQTRTIPAEFAEAALTELGPDLAPLARWQIAPSGFFVLSGATGIGKTYAACAAGRAIAGRERRREAWFTTSADMVPLGADWKTRADVEARIQTSHLLIVDDLGSERATDFAVATVQKLLLARWANLLPTIVTTNLTIEQLVAGYPGALVSRMLDSEQSQLLELRGPDRRLAPRADIDGSDPDAGLWDDA